LLEGIFVDPLPCGDHSAGLYHVLAPRATRLCPLIRLSLPIICSCRDGQKGDSQKRKFLDAQDNVGLCSVLLVSVLEDAQGFFCHRVQQNDVLPKPQTNYRREYGLPRGSSSVWWYLCLESSAKYNVLVAEHDDAGSLYKVYAVSYECLGLSLE